MEESGLELAAAYYVDVVGPLLQKRWPGLSHAAARLGGGSEVLGLDDELSRDHDWGLRLTVLVDADRVGPAHGYLEQVLPEQFAGRPVRFAVTRDLWPGIGWTSIPPAGSLAPGWALTRSGPGR